MRYLPTGHVNTASMVPPYPKGNGQWSRASQHIINLYNTACVLWEHEEWDRLEEVGQVAIHLLNNVVPIYETREMETLVDQWPKDRRPA